ncbi:hypothetical protein ACFL2H_09395 [Planctomycetota bacterium]
MHVDDRTSQPTNQFGPKAGTTRRAYVGAVYNIKPFVRVADDILDELFRKQSSERRPRPEQKRVWAEMAKGAGSCPGVNRLFVELGVEVYRRDPDRDKVLVCLMDGERKLWELQSQWLGRSVEILDFFHVLKRIREVAKFAESDEQRRESWTERQVRDLLEGRAERVIRRWARLSKQAGHPDVIDSALTYMRNNRERLNYDEYLAAAYPIGSGVAEGACRNLVKDEWIAPVCTGNSKGPAPCYGLAQSISTRNGTISSSSESNENNNNSTTTMNHKTTKPQHNSTSGMVVALQGDWL